MEGYIALPSAVFPLKKLQAMSLGINEHMNERQNLFKPFYNSNMGVRLKKRSLNSRYAYVKRPHKCRQLCCCNYCESFTTLFFPHVSIYFRGRCRLFVCGPHSPHLPLQLVVLRISEPTHLFWFVINYIYLFFCDK